MEKILSQIELSDLSGLDVTMTGNHFTFTFGRYRQGVEGKTEPIQWRVLAVKDGKALVISEKLLDYMLYHQTYEDVTWETCTLRQWMNDDFLNEAFSSSEKEKIVIVINDNPDNPYYGSEGGNATEDRIFALSTYEAEELFSSDADRVAFTTDYAHKKGYDDENRGSYWWLRSPGMDSSCAALVFNGDVPTLGHSGQVLMVGNSVLFNEVAVRPAFWLSLE